MADVMMIRKTTLTALADAIRAKTGITGTMSPEQMIQAVNDIFVWGQEVTIEKNLNNWTKNIEAEYDISFENNVNDINYIKYSGISGHERLYLPVTVTKNTEYVFYADFCSPSGFTFGGYDGYNEEHIYVMATEPTTVAGSLSTTWTRLGMSECLDNSASTTPKRYRVDFNTGSYTTVYLVLSFGYMKDSVEINMTFSNLTLLKKS